MIRRLRIKFVCINMTIVTVMLCVSFGLVLHFTQAGLERESTEMLRTVALDPHHLGVPGTGSGHVRRPYFVLQSEAGGELLTVGGGYYDLSDRALLEELLSLSAEESSGVIKDYALRYVRVVTPTAQYIVFADISGELSTMEQLLKSCLLIGAAAFFGFLLISILLARWAVKPVEVAWAQQRRFVADASHELKTPLTVILSNAQMLSDSGDDPILRKKLTGDLMTVAEQMRALVASLLRSAQVEEGREAMRFAAVNWSETVSDALLPFDSVFYERELTLESDIEEGLFVQGSRAHLTQLTDILLDNAQKYSTEHGCTQVTLRRQGRRHALLTVANEGAPLSERELRDIFKRFYRADAARERTGSYGLGLSIAEGIVRAHRGKLWAESAAGINTFSVRLPLTSKKQEQGSGA